MKYFNNKCMLSALKAWVILGKHRTENGGGCPSKKQSYRSYKEDREWLALLRDAKKN